MKQSSKRKCTEQYCHVQEDNYVAHKGVNMFCDTTYFPLFKLYGLHKKQEK